MSHEFREHGLWIRNQPVAPLTSAADTVPVVSSKRRKFTDPRYPGFFAPKAPKAVKSPDARTVVQNRVDVDLEKAPANRMPTPVEPNTTMPSMFPNIMQWPKRVGGLFSVNSLYSSEAANPLQYMFSSS